MTTTVRRPRTRADLPADFERIPPATLLARVDETLVHYEMWRAGAAKALTDPPETT